ncbi:MAG: CBS domain-containing protein [bacterium]
MRVKTLLKRKPRDVITITPKATIDDAMNMLITNKIGCLPVVGESGKLAGIISDKDIFKKVHETKGQYHGLKVADVMTTDVIVGIPDDQVDYIAGMMDKNWIRHVPIIDGEEMIGLISQRDILKSTTKIRERENRYLNLYMEGMHNRDQSEEV